MGEIKALTSLRGIAALMVVAQHFSATAQKHAASTIPSLVPHGYMAVDLFFVLSGFIMAYTYLGDFDARGVRAMPAFLLKRVARIVPLNSVAVLTIVLTGLAGERAGLNIFYDSTNLIYDTVCNLLLLQGLGFGMNLNGPSWSISTEFAAYLVFPLLLGLAFAQRKLVTILCVLLCVGALVAMALTKPRLGLDIEGGGGALLRCLTEFIIGLVTFRIVRSGRFTVLLRADWLAIAAVVCIGGSLLLRVDLLAVLAFPLIIATLAINDGKVSQALSTRVPYLLGEISFSIYLLHNPLRPIGLEVLRVLHPAPLGTPAALGAAALGTLLVIPLAWVGYRAVELPGRRWVRSVAVMLSRPRPATSNVL